MRTFVRLTQANLRSFFRDRAGLFWTIVFPLIFILLFGAIFSNAGSSRSPIGVVDLDGSAASQALIAATEATATASPLPASSPGAERATRLSDVFDIKTYATE